MRPRPDSASERLAEVLEAIGPAALAVSGGVDSTTLAAFALARRPGELALFHAVSPAVPKEATARLERLAAERDWPLTILDAGEFADERYRANPVNRCFFCKSNLYDAIGGRTTRVILSGTNMDDLGDFRPGLEAARERQVQHPYVEAGLDKAAIYRLAESLGLEEIATLPSSPCLASRIETGLRVEVPALAAVEAAEAALRRRFGAGATLRCRLRAREVGIELEAALAAEITAEESEALCREVSALFHARGIDRPVTIDRYRRGSAFLAETQGAREA